ncbi:twin-arginine translocase TatA/TatE family subunit [Streptomyces melanogenes]|uniref:twin-arginine translocase TatA/TatE family subunit n=1 Tax=Streptomyces melanogenes TaxID=67326 RepID=UPI00167D5D0D|nr:twin-arginine translocase TatA/TatE family subunit [Streptomyces melanogenes]GGP92438.1 hypothetical protein GCM10010278_83170 [Streptomyces melanogenes]
MVFNLSPFTLVALALIALFIYGPDKLPKAVGEAARGLRRLRGALRDASEGVRNELGPEYQNVQLRDLNPRAFVRKHLLEEDQPDWTYKPNPVQPPKPEGWPEHVPFPSAEQMGLKEGEDPFTAPIPLEKHVNYSPPYVPSTQQEQAADERPDPPQVPAAPTPAGESGGQARESARPQA